MENLHLMADKAIGDYNMLYKNIDNETKLLFHNQDQPKFHLIQSDFLNVDWSNASLIFTNSTCFSSQLMNDLSLKAQSLRKGAIFVTFTKRLPNLWVSGNWEIKNGFRRLMSWGIATVFIHHKIK